MSTATLDRPASAPTATPPSPPTPPPTWKMIQRIRQGSGFDLSLLPAGPGTIGGSDEDVARLQAAHESVTDALVAVKRDFLARLPAAKTLADLRGRLRQMQEESRAADSELADTRCQRSQAMNAGTDLDVADARVDAAQARVVKFTGRLNELHSIVDRAEAEVKAALAKHIQNAAGQFAHDAHAACQAAEERLIAVISPALDAVLAADEVRSTAYLILSTQLANYSNNV